MFYLIHVPTDVPRMGIKGGSEFGLYTIDKGSTPLDQFVLSELGLVEGEYELI